MAATAAAAQLLPGFQDVLWVPIGRSAGRHTLQLSLRLLLQELGVSGAEEGDAPALAVRVAEALAAQRALVVFDDAAAGRGHFELLAAAVPRVGASRVVITTRELPELAALLAAANLPALPVPLAPLPRDLSLIHI